MQLTQEQYQMIQQLVSTPEFMAIRQQARANPQIIPQLLQFLQQSNQELYNLFVQNPNLLVALIMGNVSGMEGGEEPAPNNVALDLSEADVAAIENVR